MGRLLLVVCTVAFFAGVHCGAPEERPSRQEHQAQPILCQPDGGGAAAWLNVTPQSSNPSARRGAAMAYDPSSGHVILFGGVDDAGIPQKDTWSWSWSTGQTQGNWLLVDDGTTEPTLPAWYDHAMAELNPLTPGVLMCCGTSASAGPQTWMWTDGGWTQVAASTPAVTDSAMSSFGIGIVLYGGLDAGVPQSEADIFQLGSWSTDPMPSPPPRSGHALAMLPTGFVLLFGGVNGATFQNDAWIFDSMSGSWSTSSLNDPGPRQRFGMANAATDLSNVTVLFGGLLRNLSLAADTWETDGASWTQTTPSSSPSARQDFAMAFDRTSQVVVLFGGYDGNQDLNDTWVYTPAGNCTRTNTSDAGTDAGSGDAGRDAGTDAGATDGGSGDAGDAGPATDAGATDGGSEGPGDAGPATDAGAEDAGSVQGDAGVADSGAAADSGEPSDSGSPAQNRQTLSADLGCGCASTGQPTVLLLGLLLLALRARRQ